MLEEDFQDTKKKNSTNLSFDSPVICILQLRSVAAWSISAQTTCLMARTLPTRKQLSQHPSMLTEGASLKGRRWRWLKEKVSKVSDVFGFTGAVQWHRVNQNSRTPLLKTFWKLSKSICAACCDVALIFAIMHLRDVLYFFVLLSIPFFFLFSLIWYQYMRKKWLTIPACPSLMCSFKRGNVEGINFKILCLMIVCTVYVLFYD